MRLPSLAAQPRALAVAALLLNATVWGLSWWPFRHLHGLGLHPLWSTALVYLLAAAVIGTLQPGAWRGLARSPALLALLLAAGGTNAAFNWAVSVGEVTRVVLLFYLTPLWTVPLAWALLGERPDRAVALRVALALGGALLVLTAGPADAGPQGAGSELLRRGADVLGLLGGLCFALTNVLLRREAAQPEAHRALAMFAGGALVPGAVAALCAAALPQAGIGGPSPDLAAWWAPALGLALAFLVANLALQYGAARLPANVTSVVMPVEVPIAALSAMALAGESVPATVWLGGALILLATLLAALGAGRGAAST
ncbi:MAG: DMT family transporter [Burkholderiaceae bacterium]|nr:DMT family transporter [Burkholderiaceae bacterium]